MIQLTLSYLNGKRYNLNHSIDASAHNSVYMYISSRYFDVYNKRQSPDFMIIKIQVTS